MKYVASSLASIMIVLLVAGCGGGGSQKAVLHVYNWDDYMAEGVIEKFEETYQCEVVLDTFDSNESMYAKLKAGATGYDVVFPSSYQAAIMQKEGMLHELNHGNMPNLAKVDSKFLKRFALDKEMTYSVPYMTGTTGIAYRESAVPDFQNSWAVYDRADLKGRMTLLDDMRETLGAALKLLGYSLNTTNEAEILEAGEVVKRWKQNIATFENEGYKPGIASREFHVVHGYSGDVMQVIDENEDDDIVYTLPKEGFSLWVDDMVIPLEADNVELAEKFIDFMHDPEIAAANMNFNWYVCPNTEAVAMVDDEIKEDPTIFITDDLLENAEQIMPLAGDREKYVKVWDDVKASQ